MKKIINCESGEVIDRELNDEEITQAALDAQMVAETKLALEDKAIAKAALLERLGITADEAALLLS